MEARHQTASVWTSPQFPRAVVLLFKLPLYESLDESDSYGVSPLHP